MIFMFWFWPPLGSHFGGVLGAQMEAKAFKKALQKNIKKMMPKMSPNWSQRGSQNGAKIVKNEVLEAPCFKGGSQVASRAPPGSILERFWNHFGTIFGSFLSYFWCCLLAFLLLQFGAQGSLVIEISNTADHVGTIFVSCSNIFIVILARILQQYVGNKTFKITRSHQENAAESFQETASLFVPSCIEQFTSKR